MSDALSAKSQAACKAQLLEGIQSGLTLCIENVRVTAVRRAEVDQFIEIIRAAGKTEDGSYDKSRADRPDRQSVRPGRTVDGVSGFSTGSTVYVLKREARS